MSGPATIVQAALERLNANDLDGYYLLLADNVVTVNEFSTRTGKREVSAKLNEDFGTLSEHWRQIERLVVSADHVATWLKFGGVVAASGRRWELEGCTVWEVRDGLIQSVREIADWRPLLVALGRELS